MSVLRIHRYCFGFGGYSHENSRRSHDPVRAVLVLHSAAAIQHPECFSHVSNTLFVARCEQTAPGDDVITSQSAILMTPPASPLPSHPSYFLCPAREPTIHPIPFRMTGSIEPGAGQTDQNSNASTTSANQRYHPIGTIAHHPSGTIPPCLPALLRPRTPKTIAYHDKSTRR